MKFLTNFQQYEDSEVTVLDVVSTGLHCLQVNGLKCMVQCFQDVMENPPTLGSIITVKHTGCYSTGVLKKPMFMRERKDPPLSRVIQFRQYNYLQQNSGEWNKRESHKAFFELLSRSLGIKEPSDWYKVTKDDVHKFGGQKLLRQYYNDSIYQVNRCFELIKV